MSRFAPISLFAGLLVFIANLLVPAWLIGYQFSFSEPTGFYGLQTDALIYGQLHLKLAPNPELARLDNPYLGEQNRNYRILDLSYYKGKYYSYFGIGSAVLVTIPWRLLTGSYLTEPGATAVLVYLTGLASLWLLTTVARRYFRAITANQIISGYLLLSFGNYGLIHLIGTNPGTVAQYGAYLCLTLALGFLANWRLKSGGDWDLGLASFWCAMAVACRPSFLPAAIVLLPFIYRRWRHETSFKTFLRVGLTVGLPFLVIGCGLMIYNALRFANPLEFGNRLQLTDYDYRNIPLFSCSQFFSHLSSFLFAPFEFQHYFPFIINRRDFVAIGLFSLCPFSWASVGIFRGLGQDFGVECRAFLIGIAAAFAGVFLFLAAYVVFLFHYEIDFIILWTWLAVLGWFCLLSTCDGRRKQLVSIAGISSSYVTVGVALLYTLCISDYSQLCPGLIRNMNTVVAAIDRARGVVYGPIKLRVLFPSEGNERNVPLVVTGHDHNDLLYAKLGSNQIQFAYFHAGLGGPFGEALPLDLSQPHDIEIALGSTLPPEAHPYFEGWKSSAVVRAKSTLFVSVDAKTALSASVDYFPSDPKDLLIGKNPELGGIAEAAFPGKILSVSRKDFILSEYSVGPEVETGAVIIRFKFFSGSRTGSIEPLLSTGLPGNGDLVFISYLPQSMVEFGLDHWGQPFLSRPRVLDPQAMHTVTIRSNALSSKNSPLNSFELFCDGEPVLYLPVVTHPSSAENIFFGFNAVGSSASSKMFSGSIYGINPIELAETKPKTSIRKPGVISIRLSLRSAVHGRGQPLVVSGTPGKADIVYLRLEDEHHLRIGFDHWGVGGATSDLIEFDPQVPHLIDVDLGVIRALDPTYYGPKRRYLVSLDGTSVLQGETAFYPADYDTIRIGQNRVGGSTAGETLDCELLDVDVKNSP